jgi:bifunctional non-homologous end joining protein LigD
LVFDPDPEKGLDFTDAVSAAFHARALLEQMGLAPFPMVTRGKGVHVIAPLTPQAEWRAVKDLAHPFALTLAQAEPDFLTAALGKAKRASRIFVDYLRNQRVATAVMPYRAGAGEHAPDAVPITWERVRDDQGSGALACRRCRELMKQVASKDSVGWGRADQVLRDL